MVRKRTGLWCCGLMLLVSNATALSLDQVRYTLYLNPHAQVYEELQSLIARGDKGAMLLLANRLQQEDIPDIRRMISLYQAAFDRGRGELASLGGLAWLVESYPHLKSAQKPFFERALTRFTHTQDFRSVSAVLEVSLAYPDLVPHRAELLSLYRQACIEFCQADYIAAVHAEADGELERAVELYKRALPDEPRAVDKLYRALGNDRNTLFQTYFDALAETDAWVSPVVALSIGKVFDRIADLKRVDEQLAELKRREQLRLAAANGQTIETGVEDEVDMEEGDGDTEAQVVERESVVIRAKGRYWIGRSVAGGSIDSKIRQVYAMTSEPEDYTGDEAFSLIEEISEVDPLRGRQLRASALMVIDWPTLDPDSAYRLIQEMIADGELQGELLLADLYSRGGLDEPDQQAAIAVLKKLADRGDRNAFLRLAVIYTYGHALCRDYRLGYAHALVARDMGGARAESVLLLLESLLPEDTLASAKAEAKGMLNRLEQL